ncbi:MAG: prephenate dehydrogenase [Tepidisphaeraceae bacterium]|jgi:prephenate dehydrogenase
MMPPTRITILGVGLLGGSIGLAAKSLINGCKIVGYGHRVETLSIAMERGAIDEIQPNAAEAVAGADLVILCTPVGVFEQLMGEIAPALTAQMIITDVGSTKRSIVAAAARQLPFPARFVGSHPMAGGEKQGIAFARADLYKDAICLMTPTAQSDAAAVQEVEDFWRLLGMKITRLTPEVHDQLVAQMSHLPHAVAAALVALQEPDSLALCGNGFLTTTRIAAGDGGLWRDIFLDNRDNLIKQIARFQAELTKLQSRLENNDPAAVKAWLDAAAVTRQAMAKKPD